MKRDDPYIYTRGQWKHNELAWAVLAILDLTRRMGYPPLRLKAIQEMTGTNYDSVKKGLVKWSNWGWVKRHKPRHLQRHVKPVYTYTVTAKGKRRMLRMELPYISGFTLKSGVDRRGVIQKLPFLKENYKP